MNQPIIHVGIGSFEQIRLKYNNKEFVYTAKDCPIYIKNQEYVEILDVRIGIGFHWDRKESQKFNGELELKAIDDKVLVINHIPLEKYICGVISAEMNGDNNIELLKAHAVISRSWLMAQINNKFQIKQKQEKYITWQDKDDHTLFDVCADDHCQRYQGITRAYNPNVEKAVRETFGEFLKDKNNQICDTRFSKCCGGITEKFSSCWQDVDYDYLMPIKDNDGKEDFCSTTNNNILKKILNNFDVEQNNYYSWKVEYTFDEIINLIKEKSGEEFSQNLELIPMLRGESGRIILLKIKDENKEIVFGKELTIRRILSKTHLYSSNFEVEKTPNGFILRGKGWGHGVGLCQIGAAVMAEKGYNYKQILLHYFKNADIQKEY